MGQEDVLIEVIINGKDMLQFYSTKENYKALYEDRDALIDTVKTAFKEGILYSADITNVEDIHSVQFLSEVTDVTVDASAVEQILPDGEQFETYEVVEEATNIPAATSTIPEELIIDCDLNSDERLNLCSHCDYRTFNVGHFKIHMRQHTGESPFECNQCDYKSKQKSNLKRHMRQHLLGKDHFECKLCNFTCTQEKVYKRHMILHSRTRPLKPCPFCDYFSTSLAHLTVHIRQHTGETPYHCGLCSYKTVQKSNLTRHLNKHRRGRTSKADKLRGCVYCSYRTPNPAHLLAHIRAAHTGETPYACHICSYKSAQRSNLKRHLRKHSGERPYQCNLCSYTTAYPYVLKRHIENHPPSDSYKTDINCILCDFSTNSSVEFKRHLKNHGEKLLFTCDMCSFTTTSSEDFKSHIKKHTHYKRFQCQYCDYFARQKANLLRHYQFKHPGRRRTVRFDEGCDREIKIEETDEPQENDEYTGDDGGSQEQKFEESYVDVMNESQISRGTSSGNKVLEQAMEGVVNEEDGVVTGELQYEVVEAYDRANEGNIGDSEAAKSSNLSFLNKKETEQLKEFKRLLQAGMRNAVHLNKDYDETLKSNSQGDLDNISENTESCTEDPCLEDDLNDSQVQNGNRDENKMETNTGPLSVNQLVTENTSVLIVEEGEDGASYEVYEGEVETLEETDEGSEVISCELCGYETYSVSDLKGHIGTHTGETSLVEPPVSSSRSHSYFNCDLCPFRAYRQIDVGRHKALFHGVSLPERLPFICTHCKFRTGSKNEFIDHLNGHKKKDFEECKICEQKFTSVDELKRHSRNHIGEEPFECYFCAYMTARKAHLRNHMKRKHHMIQNGKSPPHECYTCGFETTVSSEFHEHIGMHKSEERRSFKCQFDHCRFITLDQEVFRHHIELHTGSSKKEDSSLLRLTHEQSSVEVTRIAMSRGSTDSQEAQNIRLPLKEYGNLLGREKSRQSMSSPSSLSKPSQADDPALYRRKRKSLKSDEQLGSHIENRLCRRFNFNPKNLLVAPKKIENGFQIELVGEVYRAYGSLRRFDNYGDPVPKSDDEMTMIMSHPENESQLRTIYNKVKEMITDLGEGESDSTQKTFNIYFREIEDRAEDGLSDIDINISDEDNAGSVKIESDLELGDLSDFEVESKPTRKKQKLSRNVVKKAAPEVSFDITESDQIEMIQEKIRERNEKRKELRRLKALNFSMTKRLQSKY